MERLIVETLVRSVLIAMATAGVLKMMRIGSARVRHAAWLGVVAAMLVLPFWTAFGPREPIPVLRPPVHRDVLPASHLILETAVMTAAPAVHPEKPLDWRPMALGIYGFGLLVLLFRLAIGTVRSQLLVRRAVMRDGRRTSASCISPVTIGFFRPSVILPEGWDQWPDERLAAVLSHEREHARWRDPLAQWIALLNRAVFWFHPLAWWLERRISALAEEACDEAVLSGGHDAAEYSESLLAFARAVRVSGVRVRILGMAMPGQFLPGRIRRIMEGVPASRISRTQATSAVVACTAIAVLFTGSTIGYVTAHAEAPQEPAIPATPPVPSAPAAPAAVLLPSAPPAPAQPTAPAQPPEAPQAPAIAGNDFDSLTRELAAQAAALEAARKNLSTQDLAATAERLAQLRHEMAMLQEQMAQAQSEARKFSEKEALKQAIQAATSEKVQKQVEEAERLVESGELKRQLDEATRAIQSVDPKQIADAVLATEEAQRLTGRGQIVTSMIQPKYTDEARAAGMTGDVMLSMSVDPTGKPFDIRVVQGLGHGLDEAAADAVKQWRFVRLSYFDSATAPREIRVRIRFAADGVVSSEVLPAR